MSELEPDAPYRWCVHCGADCEPGEEDQEHAAYCPFSTGVWPVEADHALEVARWVRWESDDAPGDVKAAADQVLLREPVCAECSEPFRPGDSYMLRNDETGHIENRPFVGVMVCIGCASVPS